MIDDSKVVIGAMGTIYSGADAVSLYQAMALRAAMRLYAKTGIVPTRGFGKKKMVEQVNLITKSDYATKDFVKAFDHLNIFVEQLKSSIPVEAEPCRD
jgi:hypothetical protein